MKKIALLVAAMAVSSLASAQFTISGSFNLSNYSENYRLNDGNGKYDGNYQDKNTFDWEFTPSIGYMFEDYEVGINLNVANYTVTSRNTSDELYDTKDLTWGIGAYGRHYFGLTDRLSVFTELSADFALTKYVEDDVDNYAADKTFDITLTPGLCYDINDHWSLESYFNFLGLGWMNTWSDSYDKDGKFIGNGSYDSDFYFNITSGQPSALIFLLNVSIGVAYTF